MMFGFVFRKLVLHHRTITLLDSKAQLGVSIPCHVLIRCFASLKPDIDKQSFTISYLINSCGLSPDAAKTASKYVQFDNSNRPDSALSFLKDLGLSQKTHISRIIWTFPRLLLSNVDKTIVPKVHFLLSIGFSTKDIQTLIYRNPALLERSLDQCLIPCCNTLTSLHISGQKMVTIIARLRNLSGSNHLIANVSVLQGLGMPKSTLSLLITRYPNVVCHDVDKFNESVKEVAEMGFDPNKYTFANALTVKLQLSPRTWKCKIDALKKWGLSQDEILSAFRKHPFFLVSSEESLTNKMNFLVSKMGWKPAAVLKQPLIFTFSLKKRILPRCSVVRILLLKGLIKSNISVLSVLIPSNGSFVETYVIRHEKQVPKLLNVFQGNMDLEELGFGFEDKCAS